jgi:hypothetical protein
MTRMTVVCDVCSYSETADPWTVAPGFLLRFRCPCCAGRHCHYFTGSDHEARGAKHVETVLAALDNGRSALQRDGVIAA